MTDELPQRFPLPWTVDGLPSPALLGLQGESD
jgi:hypothetical protein